MAKETSKTAKHNDERNFMRCFGQAQRLLNELLHILVLKINADSAKTTSFVQTRKGFSYNLFQTLIDFVYSMTLPAQIYESRTICSNI